MGILERIQEIEREIAKTQKNKGKCQLQFKQECIPLGCVPSAAVAVWKGGGWLPGRGGGLPGRPVSAGGRGVCLGASAQGVYTSAPL